MVWLKTEPYASKQREPKSSRHTQRRGRLLALTRTSNKKGLPRTTETIHGYATIETSLLVGDTLPMLMGDDGLLGTGGGKTTGATECSEHS